MAVNGQTTLPWQARLQGKDGYVDGYRAALKKRKKSSKT
jgi:hypothetical protein